MKLFAMVATGSLLVAAGAIHTSTSSAARTAPVGHSGFIGALQAQRHELARMGAGARFQREQTTGTPTVAPTATAGTPTPTTTPTQSPYPDPLQLLQGTITAYERVARAHFSVVTNAEQANIEKVHVVATGDATCKGPSFTAHVTGKDTLEGTSQSRSVNVNFVEIKNTAWEKSSATKNKWVKIKVSAVSAFGLSVDQPLICPNSSSGSSGSSGSTQIKDPVTVGPSTFQGNPVWHVRATEVVTDTNGNTSQATLDFLIGQKGSLPYVFAFSTTDAQQHITLTQTQTLTQFGKKVTVKAPTK